MSWTFGGLPPGGGSANAKAIQGPDLEEIVTRKIGFLAIAGDTKLRLLPSGWTKDRPASPTASLLSIASNKGLVAAAGPDSLVVARTESVRQAFTTGQEADGVKTFTPEATISVPRVSHVAFSADESCLVIAAEEGGGLAVYDTNAILQGNKEPAFQVATHGVSVRHLVPNPSQDFFNYFAIVLSDGKLVLADLKERKLVDSSSGSPVFRENVSCACWSKLGKQIVAGQADGSAVQVDPTGNVKAEIPRVPQLPGNDSGFKALHLTSIYWLETFEFLMIYSPELPPPGEDMPPPEDSFYYLARREKATGACTYQQVPNPCLSAFAAPGETRPLGHQFIQRLKAWPPALDDTLILAHTGSTDIGLITKSKAPLQEDRPAEQVTNVYTTTGIDDETARRAGMPASVSGGMEDTIPVGVAMDLSSKEGGQPKPVPGDETIDASPIPLPALCVLNNEGIVSTWWLISTDGVKQKTMYPGLVVAQGQAPAQAPSPATSALGQNHSAFGSSMTPPQPQQSAFGQSSFGQSSTPAFGGASMMGNKQSAWGSSPAASAPAFGSSTPIGGGAAFGQAGGGAMGSNKASVWGGGGGAAATGGTAFGKPSTPFGSGSAMTGGSTFGKPSTPFGAAASGGGADEKPSGFASFASKGASGASSSPFAAAGASGENKSGFGGFGGGETKPAASPFGAVGGGEQKQSAFGALGGSNSSPFAAWAKDNPAQDKPAVSNENSFGSTATLGSNFSSFGKGSAFGKPSSFGTPSAESGSGTFGKPSFQTREETMDDDSTPKPEEQHKDLFGGFKLGSTFKGDGSAKDDLPKPKDPGAGMFGAGFDQALGETAKADEPATPVKAESGTNEPKLQEIPEASFTPQSPPKQAAPQPDDTPLPSDFTKTKAQVPEDAPLPPDFTQSKPKPAAEETPQLPPEDAPLPPDFTKSKPKEGSDLSEPPIAGSPPVDLGNERFSETAGSNGASDGPPDDGSEEWSEEESDDEQEDDEDGEEDEGESDDDESPGEDATETQDATRLSAFEARITPASPHATQKQTDDSTTPPTNKKDSYTPAGLPKGPVFAPPARSNQDSPRSPSPVRAVTSPVARRAVSPAQKPKPMPRTYVQPTEPVEREAPPPPLPQPTQSQIEDEEDDRIQDLLATSPEPTTEMPPFLAHQDYSGETDKSGLGGSIEKVYRDVNSMIDTLGLNARNLRGFIDGQMKLQTPGTRKEEDIEDDSIWTLSELPSLMSIQDAISDRLDEGRLENPKALVSTLHDEAKQTTRIQTRAKDLKDHVRARTTPEVLAAAQEAPLPPDAQAQQLDLRRNLREVQILLSRAEEAVSLLRADLASHNPINTSAAAKATAVPTVEAVTNTILKMTEMVQAKSADVDVLESQIRRLTPQVQRSLRSQLQQRKQRRITGSLADDYEDELTSAMSGTNLAASQSLSQSQYRASTTATATAYRTPPSRKYKPHVLDNPVGMAGMFGQQQSVLGASTRSTRFQTPPQSSRGSVGPAGGAAAFFSPGASVLRQSYYGAGAAGRTPGSVRKRMGDVGDEEVAVLQGKRERRRKVRNALRGAVGAGDGGEEGAFGQALVGVDGVRIKEEPSD
ncbi:hypothetical protein MBLNU230_g1454t1 [Neophaeotheca triangularis]